MGHGRYKSAVPASKGDKLGMAAEIGDLVKVNKLISKGVDVNITNPVSGVTPLGVAAERGYCVTESVCSAWGGAWDVWWEVAWEVWWEVSWEVWWVGAWEVAWGGA